MWWLTPNGDKGPLSTHQLWLSSRPGWVASKDGGLDGVTALGNFPTFATFWHIACMIYQLLEMLLHLWQFTSFHDADQNFFVFLIFGVASFRHSIVCNWGRTPVAACYDSYIGINGMLIVLALI